MTAEYASCFGDLETVFPMGPDGLRVTPTSCMGCENKTGCLRTAMARSAGIGVKEEIVDRAYAAGRIGFMARWARRKEFARLRQRMRQADGKKEGV